MLFLLACADTTGPGSKDGAGGSETGAGDDIVITAEVSEYIHTVVTVRWSTVAAVDGWVEFGEDTSYGHTTPLSGAVADHELMLLGMPADTEVHFRVVHEDGWASADQTITTGSLPAELPSLNLTGEVKGWVGTNMIFPIQGQAYLIVAIDDQGRFVWYDILGEGYNLMRAMLSHDGSAMIYCLAGVQSDLSTGKIMRVSLDGAERTETALPYMDHDMTELPDGTIAAIVLSGSDEMAGTADTIQELAPDGGTTEIWSAWDDEALTPYYNADAANWTHANALDYDAAEDVYYISSKELGTITKVDRKTGASLWHLNGLANEFEMLDGTELILMQHQFQMLETGVVVFDNGPMDRGYSRAAELTLDTTAMTATEAWSFRHTPDLQVMAKGDVERFEDGSTQITWSTQGEIQNVAEDGSIDWQLNTELGYAITFVQHVNSLYAVE
jgi:hypothetical protein